MPVTRSSKAKKKTHAARKARVAAALVAGRSVTEIAKKERVSRATASKEANSPEVQLLITSLVEAERDMIRTLFQKSLRAVEESFSAERISVGDKGKLINCGPDHYARLTGVKCLRDLLTAGRQAVKPEPKKQAMLTLEQLKELAEEKAGPVQ